MVEIHDPGNDAPIGALYAFLSVDEHGANGVCASYIPGLGGTPMFAASLNVAELLKPQARQIAALTGKRVVLAKFTAREDLWSA